MKFKYADYYFMIFLVLAIIGFWPSYFSKFFDGSADFAHYFHFHTISSILWVLLLIAQPMLIRSKKYVLHKKIGKLSYGLFPIVFISIVLLVHHANSPDSENLATRVWISFTSLLVFSFGYAIAIIFKKSIPIHSRGMMVAGIALLDPVMVRLFVNVIDIPRPIGFFLGISLGYILLIVFIYLERKQVKARWVFPCTLALFLFSHVSRVFEIWLPLWEDFAHWFISLPLT